MNKNEPIKNKFLYFKTQEAFDDALENGNITKDHIVVVCNYVENPFTGEMVEQNTGKVYAHGKWITGLNVPSNIDYESLATILFNYGVQRTMKWA